MQGDATYFARRAQEERVAAMKARHPAARRAHLDLAQRYVALASTTGTRESEPKDQIAI